MDMKNKKLPEICLTQSQFSNVVKFLFLFLFFFPICFIGLPQSLTVDETLSYINNIFRANPTVRDEFPCKSKQYFSYSISREGSLTATENFHICDCNKTSSYYYPGIEKNETRIIECGNINDFNIYTLNEGYSLTVSYRYVEYFEIKNKWGKTARLAEDVIQDDYIQEKLKNAFKYLFSIVQESSLYKRQDDNDPFTPHNFTGNDGKSISGSSVTNTCSLPLKADQDLNIVSLKIGSITSSFILDSGASDVSISNFLEQQLTESGDLSSSDYLPIGLYKLADGSIKSYKRVVLKNILVCNFKVTNTTAIVTSDDAPLLLGKSFLNKFKKWTIDNSKSILLLEK